MPRPCLSVPGGKLGYGVCTDHTILEQCPDKYIVSASGMAGYGDSNAIETKKITSHFYICGDQTRNAKPGRGLMAPRVAICAGHEANLILKLLVDVL